MIVGKSTSKHYKSAEGQVDDAASCNSPGVAFTPCPCHIHHNSASCNAKATHLKDMHNF
jgi:hypothetical protein